MNYIKGVDRSHLNDPIPLTSLVKKGIAFIMFKATQGLTYVDPTFDSSWKEAKTVAALVRGAYHFFDGRVDGIAQAQHFTSQGINFSAPGALQPIVDVEDLVGHNDADTADINKWVVANRVLVLKRLQDFLNEVKRITGRDCIVYSYNEYLRDELRVDKMLVGYQLWLSSLQPNAPVRFDTGLFPTFWQNTYNWNGTDMDGDYFIGTQVQLNKLANII